MTVNSYYLWIERKDRKKCLDPSARATGLRIKFSSGLDRCVIDNINALIRYLRKEYYFPVRCNILITDNKCYRSAVDGHRYYGIFYDNEDLYKNRNIYPQIAVAAQIYKHLTISDVMFTLLHELTHYYQWLAGENDRSDRSLEIEATKWANYILSEYMTKQSIKTPFGTLNIYVDGEIIDYLPIITHFEHPVCNEKPLAGCFRTFGKVESGRTIKCILEPSPSCEVYSDSGENYICQNFVKDNVQLTIGTIDHYGIDSKPYEVITVPNGLVFKNIREKTSIKLGVAWVNDLSDGDLRTWFAADPTYITE